MWVLLDNHDSFTHILHHYLLQASGEACAVVQSDVISLAGLAALNPSRLILSPGPETPERAGITMAALAHFHNKIPVLGVCLGHQAIGLHFGARLLRGPQPVHGHPAQLKILPHPLFDGLDAPVQVMRYHSLVLEGLEETGLQPIAWAEEDGTVQAIVHRHLPVLGVQFHPESVGTPRGLRLLQNWARMY